MRKLTSSIAIVLAVAATAVSVSASDAVTTRYMAALSVRDALDGAMGEVRCDYTVTVEDEGGSGIVVVPLPFSLPRRTPLMTADNSDETHLVLLGNVLPELHYGALALLRTQQEQRVRVEFRDVVIPLREYESAKGRALALFFGQAYRALKTLGVQDIAQGISLRIDGHTFDRTEPGFSQESNGTGGIISMDASTPKDVLLFLPPQRPRPFFFLFFVAVGGMLGFLTTLTFVTSKTASKWVTILGSVALLAVAGGFFLIVPVSVRYTDPSTIGLCSTAAGALLGAVLSSVRRWASRP